MATAYHKWLIQLCRGDTDCIALQLAHDCWEQNPQALELVQATGDKPIYQRQTFYKAAKLILTKNEENTANDGVVRAGR
jgi:hypothetical protein